MPRHSCPRCLTVCASAAQVTPELARRWGAPKQLVLPRDGRPRHGLDGRVGALRQTHVLGQRAATLQRELAAAAPCSTGCRRRSPVKASGSDGRRGRSAISRCSGACRLVAAALAVVAVVARECWPLSLGGRRCYAALVRERPLHNAAQAPLPFRTSKVSCALRHRLGRRQSSWLRTRGPFDATRAGLTTTVAKSRRGASSRACQRPLTAKPASNPAERGLHVLRAPGLVVNRPGSRVWCPAARAVGSPLN